MLSASGGPRARRAANRTRAGEGPRPAPARAGRGAVQGDLRRAGGKAVRGVSELRGAEPVGVGPPGGRRRARGVRRDARRAAVARWRRITGRSWGRCRRTRLLRWALRRYPLSRRTHGNLSPEVARKREGGAGALSPDPCLLRVAEADDESPLARHPAPPAPTDGGWSGGGGAPPLPPPVWCLDSGVRRAKTWQA
jgi:hypothetical protein